MPRQNPNLKVDLAYKFSDRIESELAVNWRRNIWLKMMEKPIPADPLLPYFEHDKPVAELYVSSRAQCCAYSQQRTLFTIICPPALVCCLFTGVPCNLLIYKDFKAAARARHLTLRENSLYYHLEVGKPMAPNLDWCQNPLI